MNDMATDPITVPRSAQAAATIPGLWWKVIAGLGTALMIYMAFVYVGPATLFPNPDGARAIFFHVPSAYVCILVLIVGTWNAGKYFVLRSRGDVRWAEADRKSGAAMEASLVFGIVTLITGMMFSKMEWGAYWSWDPRQTSMLIVCLILAAYIVFRGAVDEPDSKARLSAGYALISFIPVIFLLTVLPRIIETLHGNANVAVIGGKITGGYRLVMYPLALPCFLMIAGWIIQLRVRLARLEIRHEETR